MTLYIGIDDTDTIDSRGTGRLARAIASSLSRKYPVLGVTRHQLFVHPSIPYTSHNSSAVIHLAAGENGIVPEVFQTVRELMLDDFIQGSDPGLAVAAESAIPSDVKKFGRDAKGVKLTQESAYDLAQKNRIILEALGGTGDGVIGALAGIGLAASQNDGRFITRGKLRELTGEQEISKLLDSGIDEVRVREGNCITQGSVFIKKFPKPAFITGKAVLFVDPCPGGYCDIVIG
jgi:hypothetical protein